MKRIFALLAALCMACTLFACGKTPSELPPTTPPDLPPAQDDPTVEEIPAGSRTAVIYFSCTGHTKEVAQKIAELTGGDLIELTPAQPYTSDDLAYSSESCRANQEQNDPTARPALAGDPLDLTQYGTVYLGYPIWWGTAPRIINTFLDSYDLTGKTVRPFCTSGSSGIGASVADIRAAIPGVDVQDGLRVSGAGDPALSAWIG